MVLPALQGWDSFYVIIGSSAAALTGLMFVVIALPSRIPRDPKALEAFASPTVAHFCAVLLIGAIITIPRHTLDSLQASLLIVGAIGVVYAALVIRRTVRQRAYAPQLEDWIFHAILPVVAYATVLIASAFIAGSPERALVGVSASALLLLFIGIHNAWDTAVYMTTEGESMERDERAIRDLMDRWRRATESGDVDSVLGLMTDDVIFLTPHQPPMNKEKFAAGLRGFAGKVKFEAKQDVKELAVSGDLAYAWTQMSITMDGKTRAGNILSVFRKIDGKWMLSRDANFVA